jgi:O-antigen/teichoic acid export membrane protein
MFLATLFTVLLGQTDVLLMSALRGSLDAGLYSAAARTGALVGLALVAGNAVVAPMIASCHSQGDVVGLRRVVRTGTRMALAGSLTLAAALVVFGREVLAFFGPEYAGSYAALLVLCAGQVISAGIGPVGYLLSLTGHERTAARVYGVCAVVNVAASAILIPRWGLTGAAVATAGSMVMWNVWLRVLVRERLNLGGFLFAREGAA